MIITRERLTAVLTPEAYIAAMQENKEAFQENLAAVRFTDAERAAFEGLPQPLMVLAMTEEWCGDSVANLPIVIALARETGALDLRILPRAGNEDITDRYTLGDGRNHIPTYIALDGDLNEVGHFIERTPAITDELNVFRREWFAARPESGNAETPISELSPEARAAYLPAMRAFRTGHRELERQEMVAAFARLAQGLLVAASAR